MKSKTKADPAGRAAPMGVGTPRDTKRAQLIRLLSTKTGADLAAISGKFGWQPHTTCAAIYGLKKAGYEVATERPDPDKPTRYRISASRIPAIEEE